MKTIIPKLALAVMVPLLFLAGTELLLRAVGAGYPTSFLRPALMAGKAYWINNPFYGYRFFPHRAARNPAPLLVPEDKAEGLIRIAVLGESAAMGDPAIEFSLARGLDKMLNEPGKPARFEVINAAMTAINSHVIADIAEELGRRDVDVFVIYMGNNEVVGPFGPGTAITRGNWGERLTPWRVALTRGRLSGLLRAVAEKASGTVRTESWIGMEMFEANRLPRDDARLAPVYRSYARNLRRILRVAEDRGIRVVLCTMAVNLSDCAPFGSINRTDLAAADLREWNALYRAGRQAYADRNSNEARTLFEQALTRDDSHAELRYRLGHVLMEQGHGGAAREHLEAARDLDIQRFRADGEINRIIRRLALDGPSVILADVESEFSAGEDANLFVDHVHFSMTGLYHISRTVHEALSTWVTAAPAPSAEDFWMRLMVTPWSERKEASLMSQRRDRPPFTTQWGNKEHRDRLHQRMTAAAARIAEYHLDDIERAFARQQTDYPADFYYAQQWAHILTVENRWEQAAPVWEKAIARLGGYSDWHAIAALAQAITGQPEQAAKLLAATGPPYGHYLAESASVVIETLRSQQRDADARVFAEALLAEARRFDGRKEMQAWLRKK